MFLEMRDLSLTIRQSRIFSFGITTKNLSYNIRLGQQESH